MKFKTAQEWQDELHGETSLESIESIQILALNWARGQYIPDGNPECFRDKIDAKIKELELRGVF